MEWILILSGLGLLLLAVLLTHWICQRMANAARAASPYCRPRVKIRLPDRTSRLLVKALRLNCNTPSWDMLHSSARALMEHLMILRGDVRNAPALPVNEEHEPRLMALAREIVDAEGWTPAVMLDALAGWEDGNITPSEAACLPLCMKAAQCDRMAAVLTAMVHDARECRRAHQLGRHLSSMKHPLQAVEKAAFSPSGLSCLLTTLRAKESHELIAAMDEWLEAHGTSAESITVMATQRQVRLAEEIRRAQACFTALTNMDWTNRCEVVDPTHRLLEKDPAKVYIRMTAESRLALRLQVDTFCRRLKLDATSVIECAMQLSGSADDHALERYIGYWFQDEKGLITLHRALGTRRGYFYTRLALRVDARRYAALWLCGGIAGFMFLQGHQPVFMLPFFALTAGCIFRQLLHRHTQPMPAIELPAQAEELRTLVVLPSVLHDSHEAIRRVRRLKIFRQAFADENADFLLLGDFADNMTAVSSGDAAILSAAASAIAALEDDGRYLYIQRARIWDGDRHTYCARGGRQGAISEICRLIAQGECADVLAYASPEAAALERRYAYVLVLPSDCQPEPGLLKAFLQRMTHPLFTRTPTEDGWRGYAMLLPEDRDGYDGVGLIRPDAYLEATDGLINPTWEADALFGELSGQAVVPGALLVSKGAKDSWDDIYHTAVRAWRIAPWQLPYVQTPIGLIRNPLRYLSRFRLRERLRASLIPLAQCLLLLWSVLTGSWLLLLIALLAPEAGTLPHKWGDLIQLLCRLTMLPTRAVVNIRAIVDLLRRKEGSPPAWGSLEIWSQWLFATLLLGLGLALPHMTIPALAIAVFFACYPWILPLRNLPLPPSDPLSNDQFAMLENAADRTWRFFIETVTEETQNVPLSRVQYEPRVEPSNSTSPESIGAYLLTCVCAKDMGYQSANTAAERIQQTLDTLTRLPLPMGLPCREYALPSLTVLDARVDTAAVGFLLAALMVTAQALRTWLPELDAKYEALSALAEQYADSLQITKLYDKEANLFIEGLDQDGQPTGIISCFADEALVLSVAACARRIVPSEHIATLRKSAVSLHGSEVLLSRHGAASSHLMPGLFFPMEEQATDAYIRILEKHGHHGVFGQAPCGHFAFDPALHYQTADFGLPEISLENTAVSSVFAPYAAALCLAQRPHQAAEALLKFEALGAQSTLGFCDAVDFSAGTALVGMHDAFHQGLLFMSLAHVLADAPIRRYFCAIPEVEACLPLLENSRNRFVLPFLPVKANTIGGSAATEPSSDLALNPNEAALIGGQPFHLLVNTCGALAIRDGELPLTRRMQFYLKDEGRMYCLNDEKLPGQAIFAPGEVCIERLCGSIRVKLICTVDAVHRRAIHMLTLTNLSTRDRIIEAADCLLPDLGVPINTMEASRPAKGHLSLHGRCTERQLHHMVSISHPPLAITACTDALVFTGRSRTMDHPATLEDEALDLVESTAHPCLSFRVMLSLGSRGQATLWYTTSTLDTPAPQLLDLAGIRRLAAMQHRAIEAVAPLSGELQEATALLCNQLISMGPDIGLRLRSPSESTLLADMAQIAGRLMLHGIRLRICISCPQDMIPSVEASLQGLLSESLFHKSSPEALADCPLVLEEDAPLLAQLRIKCPFTPTDTQETHPAIPALLPKLDLEARGAYGGFQPETGSYVVQLEPGMTTPAPWTNHHVSRYFREEVDESGFRTPFDEQAILRMEDGTSFTPWDVYLPRIIRMDAGVTIWETWSDRLDVKLCATSMPGHRCGLRVLRVRNATDETQRLHIAVKARLAESSFALEYAPGLVITALAVGKRHHFLAGNGWTTPTEPVAQLEFLLELAPHATGEACWLAGYARHAEDVAAALASLEKSGASALLRQVRNEWAQRLHRLTITTPEASFDRLMNHILPQQAMTAQSPAQMLVLVHLAPGEAKRALLQSARFEHSREEWAQLSLLTSTYVQVTGDASVLNVHLARHEATLFDHLVQQLVTLPRDRQGLPLGDRPVDPCFLYAHAALALNAVRSSESLQEFSRRLLSAADSCLWQDGYYGEPLHLATQYLACDAYGETVRTRQAVRTAWAALYDRPHGLLRQHEPQDIPTLPGLPENGGMVTLDAVLFLRALLTTGHTDEAHELLQALNPLHHTDDPLRAEIFRCAPYLLHGGMYASPLEAGRATSDGGAEAAAQLYAIVLQDVLGFRRSGDVIRLLPQVPSDWDAFTLTLQEGASTWRISAERTASALTIDGVECKEDYFIIQDDGRIHQVHIPLK